MSTTSRLPVLILEDGRGENKINKKWRGVEHSGIQYMMHT